MTGIHSSNIYKYLSNKKVLGINSYKAICEKIDADPGMYLNDTFNAVLLTKPHGKLRAVKVLKATDQSQYIDALKEHGGEYFTSDKFYISLKYEESHYDIIEIVGNAMNDGTDRSISSGTLVLGEVIDLDNKLNGLRIYSDLYFIATVSGIILTIIDEINESDGTILCSFFNEKYKPQTIRISNVLKMWKAVELVRKRFELDRLHSFSHVHHNNSLIYRYKHYLNNSIKKGPRLGLLQ